MTQKAPSKPDAKSALQRDLQQGLSVSNAGNAESINLKSLSQRCVEFVQQPASAVAFVEEVANLQSSAVPLWIKPRVLEQMLALLQGTASPGVYLWLHNEQRAVQQKRLISELVFSLSNEFSAAKNDALVSIVPSTQASFNSVEFGREYSSLLQAVLNGVGGEPSQEKLAAFCRESIHADTHEYAAVFWLTCGCYISGIDIKALEVSAAHRYILRQIELVVQQHVVNSDSAILSPEGIELVEQAMCNMLFYIACAQPTDPVFEQLDARFEMQRSLQGIDTFTPAIRNGALLDAGARALRRSLARLQLDVDVLPDSTAAACNNAIAALTEINDACTLIVADEQRIELTTALTALKAYQGRDGTLGDLEQCAASLINVDQHLSQVETVGEQSAGSVASESALLDDTLRIEMISLLQPLESSDPEDDPEDSVSRDWLVAALADSISLAAFLKDDYLFQQINRLRAAIRTDAAPLSCMQELAQAIRDFLIASQINPGNQQAQEELFQITQRLSVQLMIKDEPEPAVDLMQLAGDSADLLVEDAGQAANPADNQVRADSESIPVERTPGELATQMPASALEFGGQCNNYVDTIQLALDTALGSSGNLAPDKTVTTALQNLYQIVRESKHDSLLHLLEPLMQVLTSAEQTGSTLSQTDTLLVQEAIVAITIGLDAVVNKQAMPDLVADVSQRITQMALEDSHATRGGFEAAGLIDLFVEEGEELGQRLFELFQRWRGAPRGSSQADSKIQTDIRRLLHTLKGSADTVSLSHIAGMVHALESFMAQQDDKQEPSAEFFDVAIDAIEVVLDDIDRVRNGESVLTREETLLSLNSNFAETPVQHRAQHEEGGQLLSGVNEASDSVFERVPAFGSVKYFSRLEKTQKQLSRECWEVSDLHVRLRKQISDMRSSLQSAQHLLGKVPADTQSTGLYRSIDESVHDLQELQSGLQSTIELVSAVEDKQLARVAELESLVLSAEKISVESIRLRMEALVRQMAESQGKQLHFEFVGAELELERKLFADLIAPLEQLLINAVVHGVDSAVARSKLGKANKSTIQVVFEVLEGKLLIAVSDDGAGVNLAVLRKQVGRRPNLAQMALASDSQVLSTIVEQGVTTTDSVDRTSGRGVGLDIVKEWVYKHHGELTVDSRAGYGTVFNIEVPLPSQAVQVMVIQQGEHFFAIDIEHVAEIEEAGNEGVSLASLLALDAHGEPTVLSCRTRDGLFKLKVENLLGRKTIKFHRGNRVVHESGFYEGAGLLDNRHVVLRLCVNKLSQAVPAEKITVQQPGKVSVLIVDDSVTIRASFGRAMQSAGYQITLARNGLEAMEYLEDNQPEVIILDLEMPLMDGYELGAYIRKQPRLSRTALVVVSSKPRSVVRDWLSAVNADAYYEKPCSESVIAGVVAGLA